jgi:hypothetical protein
VQPAAVADRADPGGPPRRARRHGGAGTRGGLGHRTGPGRPGRAATTGRGDRDRRSLMGHRGRRCRERDQGIHGRVPARHDLPGDRAGRGRAGVVRAPPRRRGADRLASGLRAAGSAARRAVDLFHRRTRRGGSRAAGPGSLDSRGHGGDRAPGPQRALRGRRRLGVAIPHASPPGAAPRRQTALPARRRRAPVQPVRRRGAQLGPAGRAQPRLEARAGAAWPRPPEPARQLRARTGRRRPPRPGDLRQPAPAGRERRRVGPDRRVPRPAVQGTPRRDGAVPLHARRLLRGHPAGRRVPGAGNPAARWPRAGRPVSGPGRPAGHAASPADRRRG